ncbi:MAG: DUF2851 family protein [Ignavibacteria bacterium]|nr:DUF2851 family protein [Ignavibacteria bacterium]
MSPHTVSESIFREMWLARFFEWTPLYTNDNARVKVLGSGRLNNDAGPDILDARIRIGETIFHGDVEFHVEASSWYAHGHHLDEHYNRTILHLVFFIRPSDRPAFTLSGRQVPLVLTNPSSALTGRSCDPHLPCYDFNRSVTQATVTAWLAQLAWIRMERRVLQFGERLKRIAIEEQRVEYESEATERTRGSDTPDGEVLWEQLLYEGLMEAAGYEKNRKPFLDLARSVRIPMLRRIGFSDSEGVMALLFGAAGLLPPSRTVADPESRAYLHRLLRRWRILRRSYRGPLLHAGDWLFFRLRPANFPTARLAAICFLLPQLFGNRGFRGMVSLLARGNYPARETLRKFDRVLTARPDSYWRTHFRFGPPTVAPVYMPGRARRLDMIANVLLPVMILYGRTFRLPLVEARAFDLFSLMPSLQNNRITRIMETELPGNLQLRSASLQQGAIQLSQEYCSRGRCGQCAIGRSVGLWGLSSDRDTPGLR